MKLELTEITIKLFLWGSRTVSCKVNPKCKFLGRMCWMNYSIEDSQEHVVNSPNMMGGVIVYLGLELVDKLDKEVHKLKIELFFSRL